MADNGPNGWGEWGRHVLEELKRNSTDHVAITEVLQGLRDDVVGLKYKAGLWGAIGASIPAIAAILVILLVR